MSEQNEVTEAVKKDEDPDKDRNPFWKESLLFLRDVAIYMAVVILIANYIIRPVQVIGSSMYPTLEDGQFGFSNLIGLHMDGISRFDVVTIYMEDKEEYLVKRVVGLPGETVSYKDGQLYINGEAVAETFFNEEYRRSYGSVFMEDVAPVTLGEDEYYCLGDNRPRSNDSRYYGPFELEQIRSKGVLIVFPFSKMGFRTW